MNFIIVGIFLLLLVRELRVPVYTKLAYKKGFKEGYGTGLTHGKVAYTRLQEVNETLRATCYIDTIAHINETN